jgi:cell division protease FtsH
MVEYGEHEDYVFLGRDMSRSRDYSESTAQEIDREVRRLVDEAYSRAKKIITDNRSISSNRQALLEYETLDAEQIKDIIEHGEMRNPPTMPPKQTTPPPIPAAEQRPEPGFPPGSDRATGVTWQVASCHAPGKACRRACP